MSTTATSLRPSHDQRNVLRQFRERPGFVAISILTLALGIGASNAIIAVLLEPLPFAQPDRLVAVRVAARCVVSIPTV